MSREDDDVRADFESVLAEGAALQRQLPWLELVVVGGAAAAIHAGHRYSLDTDHVSRAVSDRFEEIVTELQAWEGWKTNRIRRPFVILGERHRIQLGIRQQRRAQPLEVEELSGLRVPTLPETLRIKTFLCTDRQATRDYLDVAALADALGIEPAIEALKNLNRLYRGEGNQSCVTRFAEVSQQDPVDLHDVRLASYRGVKPPYDEWAYVRTRVSELGLRMAELEMKGELTHAEKAESNDAFGDPEPGNRRP